MCLKVTCTKSVVDFGCSTAMLKKVTRAKVAVFTSALDIAQTETKGTVLIKNADEMLNFTKGEEQHLEKVTVCYFCLFRHRLMSFRFSKKSQILASKSS